MKKTNCVNCGGTIDSDTARCPFCGTSYVDLFSAEIRPGERFVIRFPDICGMKLLTAYIKEYSVLNTGSSVSRDADGKLCRCGNKRIVEMKIVAEETD